MAALRKVWCQCCIAGGGPAGIMLGYLLARAGLDVVVLEKHADFFRDFRGDTIHPSTLALFDELGLLSRFLQLPHHVVRELRMAFGSSQLRIADLGHLRAPCKFIALMPQWDFLDFLAGQARAYPTFSLHMATEATGLIEQQGRIVGVRARTDDGELEVHADLCVAADGRHSTLRERAGLQVRDLGAPMDVLWFRLARRPDAPDQPLGRFGAGWILVAIDRGDYWQCGYVIPKGGYEALRARGLEAFREPPRELRALARRGDRGARDLGRDQAAHRQGRSPGALVAARPPVHRRRGACDVAGRRRRRQPCDPGCGRHGQRGRRTAARCRARRRAPGARPASQAVARRADPAAPAPGAEPGHRRCPERGGRGDAANGLSAVRPAAAAAPHPGAADRPGRAPGAHRHARRRHVLAGTPPDQAASASARCDRMAASGLRFSQAPSARRAFASPITSSLPPSIACRSDRSPRTM